MTEEHCPQCLATLPEDAETCPKCDTHFVSNEKGEKSIVDPSKYFDQNGAFVPMLLAEELMEKYHFATLMDSQEVYIYLDGYYQALGEVIIKRECKKRLQGEYRKNRAGEVLDYIIASTYVKRREEPPNLLPLQNGVLDINTMELKSYSPEYMFFNKIPVNYDLKADCPEIKQFHREIVNGEDEVSVLEEIIGFCLYRSYFIAKSLMLVGGGANGKSTWLSLVRTFLGAKNVSGRGLYELEENRFAKADLYSKYANIYADLPDQALQRTGTFKMLTGGDQITAEKKWSQPFNFVNYSKLFFSANKVPEALDDTDSFFRRWFIITFPNVFNEENCDPYKLEKLVTEQELSGLLNIALASLKKLLKNGAFSNTKTTEAIREDYIRRSSPLAAFVTDCLETDSDAFIIKKELFQVFTEYCRVNSIPSVTQDTFFKNLPRHAVVTDYRPQVGNNRYYTLKGLRYGLGASNLSKVSRVFYTLIKRKAEFENNGFRVDKLEGESLIKVMLPLDSIDRLDTKLLNPSERWIHEQCRFFNPKECVKFSNAGGGSCQSCPHHSEIIQTIHQPPSEQTEARKILDQNMVLQGTLELEERDRRIGLRADSCEFWHTDNCTAGVPSAIFSHAMCPETCKNYRSKSE